MTIKKIAVRKTTGEPLPDYLLPFFIRNDVMSGIDMGAMLLVLFSAAVFLSGACAATVTGNYLWAVGTGLFLVASLAATAYVYSLFDERQKETMRHSNVIHVEVQEESIPAEEAFKTLI